MKKIFQLIKKSLFPIICILGLLFIQVGLDLKLPEYTANIINVGIGSNGIKDNVPNVVRETDLNLAIKLADVNQAEIITNSYKLVTKEDSDYLEDYSILETENLYVLKDINKEERKELNDVITNPMLISYFLTSDAEEVVKMRSNMLPDEMKNADFNQMLAVMNEEQIASLKENFNKAAEDLEPSLLNQMSIAIVKAEYSSIGYDVKSLQSHYLLIEGAKMIGVALASMVIMIIIAYLASVVGSKFSRDLRSEVTSKVMSFSNAEFESFGVSSLITRSTNDIQQVQMLVIMVLRMVLYAPILGIGAFTKISDSPISWVIGVALLSILTLVAILLVVAMPKFKKLQSLVDKINLVSREILTGLPVIRAFATEKEEEKRFDKANIDLTKTNLFVNRTMAIMMPTMMFIMNGVSVLIIWVGSKYVDVGSMQVGTLMAFISYTMQIIMAFLMLTMISIMMPRAIVSLKRISEIFKKDVSIADPELPKEFTKSGGLIEFKDVYFRYPDAEEEVLENINLKIKSGTTTAFIGSTGSGKSTLINLIPRFFDVSSGQILLDGVDIKDVTLKNLRSKIGFVPQKGVLFTGTIASNISFGEEFLSEEQIKSAASIAQATEFIDTIDNKYKAPISQGGTNVSGGQKQRLAIARAIAKNPEILIFDDSFSALDFKTDALVRSALKKNLSGRTVLIVASRIATVMDADQIVVLDNGQVVGVGSHKELIKNNEVYKEIAYSQLSEEEINNA